VYPFVLDYFLDILESIVYNCYVQTYIPENIYTRASRKDSMGNGDLSGSDFLYIALGGIAVYGAYQFFKKDGVVAEVINNTGSGLLNGTTSTPQMSTPAKVLYTISPAAQAADAGLGLFDYFKTKIDTMFAQSSRNEKAPSFVDPYIPGAPNFSTPTGAVFVDTSGKLPNYTSITGQSVYVAPPKTTSATYSSMLSTSKASSTVAKTSSVTPKTTIGAKVGTIFKSGASVKSVGKSGKY